MFAFIFAGAAALAIVSCGDEDGADRSSEPTGSAIRTDRRLPTPAGRIVGYVRDVNGWPVPGARVRLTDGGQTVRASRSGTFELPARPGQRMLVAEHPAYTRQSIATILRRARGARVDFSLAVAEPDRVSVANSADRLIVWTSCKELVELSDGELQRWIGRGVDGFVCQTGHLSGLGGNQDFTGGAGLRGSEHSLQRRLRGSPAVRRAKEGKLLLYLGFYATNHFNKRTPLENWFDDRAWSRVLTRVQSIAGAARTLGFTGLAIDQEIYPQSGGAKTASWSWRYPGNRRGEAEVRAKVKERGRQLMKSMVRVYPGLELVGYDTSLPGSWEAKVQAEINDSPGTYAPDVRIDLWDGLSSVEGYSAIRWMDATFYKTPHLPGSSWDTALEYNANRIYSYLSRRFSNWSYASSRLHLSPFSWVDSGPDPSGFEKARGPGHVAEQLEAFKKWGVGGAFANYAYGPLEEFDYRPYVDALRAASRPARVDRRPPKLALTSPPGTRRLAAGKTISLEGTASDDFAIRAVRWYDHRGRQGVARLIWKFSGDERSRWNGEMRWSIDNLRIAPDAGRVTISAEDIKGLATEISLTVTR